MECSNQVFKVGDKVHITRNREWDSVRMSKQGIITGILLYAQKVYKVGFLTMDNMPLPHEELFFENDLELIYRPSLEEMLTSEYHVLREYAQKEMQCQTND